MARGLFWLLGGAMAAACALPDVSIVSSFGGDAGAGRGGAGSAGKGGTAGGGGSSGKVAGGTSGSGTSGGEGGDGDGGDGMAVGGVDGQTGGAGGDAGRGGAGAGGAGTSSGGASAGTSTGATSGGGATAGGASGAAGGGISGSGGKSSSVCGDGTREPDEACDDGNSLVCGTCAADCLSATPLAPARGTIRVEAGAVEDGEKFTLDDGFGGVDFEFDDDDAWDDTLTRIPFTATVLASPNALRDLIIEAVNSDNLGIIAEAGTSEGEVVLTNERPGSAGNHPITDQVNSSGFTHTGMSGGAGADCPNGTACFSGDTCTSMSCIQDLCAP